MVATIDGSRVGEGNAVSGTVTFDGAPPEGTINLGIGQPSADMLPVDIIAKASADFLAKAEPFELNYGVLPGDERFLGSLAAFLSDGYGHPADANELFVTAGNSQAIDLVSNVFANAGDTVFVEEPSYFLAFQIFRDHDLNVVGIPVDEPRAATNTRGAQRTTRFFDRGGRGVSAAVLLRPTTVGVRRDDRLHQRDLAWLIFQNSCTRHAAGMDTDFEKTTRSFVGEWLR